MNWYEDKTRYEYHAGLPQEFFKLSGPHGPALVRVFGDGKTEPGWGLQPTEHNVGFMVNYVNDSFWERPRLRAFMDRKPKPYAIIMRSVNIIALDIDRHLSDGGADGFIAASKLELPPTLAETSKSGKGRHLFYATNETWDNETGFGAWDDVIGLVPGVDVRAVGCMYRYPQQLWNDVPIAPVPDTITELLTKRRERKQFSAQLIAAAAAADPDDEEALIMHDALIQELAKPIPVGKRNATLFAIGTKLHQAAVPDWDKHLGERAADLGLDAEEADKIITNITKYN